MALSIRIQGKSTFVSISRTILRLPSCKGWKTPIPLFGRVSHIYEQLFVLDRNHVQAGTKLAVSLIIDGVGQTFEFLFDFVLQRIEAPLNFRIACASAVKREDGN